MNKYFPNIILALLFLIAASFGYVFYLFFQPFTPPSITPYPIPITNQDKRVHYGEAIQTKVHVCIFWLGKTTSSVKYQNTEGRFYLFASHDSVPKKKGCFDSEQNREPVPESLPPGKYTIYVTSVFHVNPLKEVTKIYETEEFELVKN